MITVNTITCAFQSIKFPSHHFKIKYVKPRINKKIMSKDD